MMTKFIYVSAMLSGLTLTFFGCSKSPATPDAGSGEFTLLTYNVAGLPQGASASNPEQNTRLISPLLNNYDLVLVQEDFFYHAELSGQADHPYRSTPSASKNNFTSGDGLNRFSEFRFGELQRTRWDTCSSASGGDCLAQKGFSLAETEIAAGVKIDVYNVHMDAGGEPDDIQAREVQVAQLLAHIAQRSSGKAIIVAGDFNLNIETRPNDLTIYENLLQTAGLADACAVNGCNIQSIDRVLLRSSAKIQLDATEWRLASEFVDGIGRNLSDHSALGVSISWRVAD